ncbi:MAG: protein translocase subunit SecF [Oligoflexia bacterium]|nr:protein translocase subunit SecF [Oligoflexia bacterium]
MELISHNTKFDFMGIAKIPLLLSVLLVAFSIYVWFEQGDSKYGVDFKGGNEFLVKFTDPTNSEAIRQLLNKSGLDGATVQAFEGDSNEFSIRIGGEVDSKSARAKVDSGLTAALSGKYQIVKSDYIGPTIGEELRRKGLIATVLAMVMILAYVSYRFEFAFALGAVLAVFHDVIVATGVYLLAGHQINMGTVAGALTIVGYSVNDTIVIFDRVREELLKDRHTPISSIFNTAINFTLSRTVVTSLLTLLSACALLVLGGGAIRDLSLYLVAGIIAGCYSTVFIASPIVVLWEKLRGNKTV